MPSQPSPNATAALVADLHSLLGPAGVLTGDAAAASLRDPRASVAGAALAVVRPGHHDHVVACVELCRRHDAVIVPQGGNSGMSGGQIPVPADDRPVVVVTTTSLRRIVEVNAAASTITAEAGVTIHELQEQAAAVGRSFAPDWGARGTATLGGAIATNAGGNNVVRYGSMRNHVLGVRAVLADGRAWDGLRSLRKDSSGYDLKQLFIGSEGTLGIVTAAVVSLQPATPHSGSAWAALRSLDDLAGAAEAIRSGTGETLTALELIPRFGVDHVCARMDITPPLAGSDAEWFLLVKLAGADPVAEPLAGVLAAAVDQGHVTDAVVAATADQEERLWTIRDELSPSRLFPLQHSAIKGDLAVPVDRMGLLYNGVAAIQADLAPAAVTYGFGHVGDGNLHLYVLPVDGAGQVEIESARAELIDRIDHLVVDLGGTLSGEHGIGRELLGRIGRQKSDVEWDMMRAVKTALDPEYRLNPGVMLPPG